MSLTRKDIERLRATTLGITRNDLQALLDRLDALEKVREAADAYLHTPIPIDLEPYAEEILLQNVLSSCPALEEGNEKDS